MVSSQPIFVTDIPREIAPSYTKAFHRRPWGEVFIISLEGVPAPMKMS